MHVDPCPKESGLLRQFKKSDAFPVMHACRTVLAANVMCSQIWQGDVVAFRATVQKFESHCSNVLCCAKIQNANFMKANLRTVQNHKDNDAQSEASVDCSY